MKEYFDNKVVNDAATKKKYVSPEIVVVNLDEQPKLLSASTGVTRSFGAGLSDDEETDW